MRYPAGNELRNLPVSFTFGAVDCFLDAFLDFLVVDFFATLFLGALASDFALAAVVGDLSG